MKTQVTLSCNGKQLTVAYPVTIQTIEKFANSCGFDPFPLLEPVDLIGINSPESWGFFGFYDGIIEYK